MALATTGLVVVPLVAFTVARAGTIGTGRPAGAAWGTFPPVADGYVNSEHATRSYGGALVLRTDAAPGTVRSYLRFRVGGLAGPVRAATLRLFAESGSRNGLEVRGVADTGWEERTLQFVTAPPVQSAVASTGPIRARTWVTADVTALVKGNGDVGMALVALGVSAVRYASREAGLLAPQLVVEAGSQRPLATPARPAGAAEGGEVVVAAAGDIACHPDEIAAGYRPCQHGATANLLAGLATCSTRTATWPRSRPSTTRPGAGSRRSAGRRSATTSTAPRTRPATSPTSAPSPATRPTAGTATTSGAGT